MNARIRHFGITVGNLETALDFYCGGLGFSLVRHFERPKGYTEAVTGVSGTTLAAAIISLGDVHVELLEYSDREDRSDTAAAVRHPGAVHICVEVASIEGMMASLREKGARFRPEISTVPTGPGEGNRVIYGWDPEGIAFELVQKPERESMR